MTTVDAEILHNARAALDHWKEADSNDAEHDAGFEMADVLEALLAPRRQGSGPQVWRVDDNVTGHAVSREFDTDDAATAVCREFNSSPAAGGRYHVVTWIDDGLEWRRAR